MQIDFENWRLFREGTLNINDERLFIIDTNGSGKTSIISMLYTLYTGDAWPLTSFKDHIKAGSQYAAIRAKELAASVVMQYGNSGRVGVRRSDKMLDKILGVTCLTYKPDDNLWWSSSRGSILAKVDSLINSYTSINSINSSLNKAVKNKQSLLRAYRESGEYDITSAVIYTDIIHNESLALWNARSEWVNMINSRLGEFDSWVETDAGKMNINWYTTDDTARRSVYREPAVVLTDSQKQYIINKEVNAGVVLYGAQRDDITLNIGKALASNFLSRGEMRALVMFILSIMRDRIDMPVIWLLDDMFNELDENRERVILDKLVRSSDKMIVTCAHAPMLYKEYGAARAVKDLIV
jgi:DNA replication and repair protein RecF